jgi:hypothetical protein
MSDAYVIQTAGQTAGIVVRERDGFRFFASLPALIVLEERSFPSLGELHRAIAQMRKAIGPADRHLPAWSRRPRMEAGRAAA